MPLRRGSGVLLGLGFRTELDLGVGQHGANDDENAGAHVDRHHEKILLRLGDGALDVHGGLVAAEAEDFGQFAAGEQEEPEGGQKGDGKAICFAWNEAWTGHV